MDWVIPLISNESLIVTLEPTSPVFVVGPNGSGKSALIQHAVTSLGAQNVRRISAHRQTWLQSSAIDITPQSRRQFDQNFKAQEPNPDYRWRQWAPEQQVSSVLFDLTAKDNDSARRVRSLVDSGDLQGASALAIRERSVFVEINQLLKLGGLPVRIENSEGEDILALHEDTDEPYSMAQMSDGERNAVILAANVLTVDSGTVLLIDEPERHLHRSIIEPFLAALFAKRRDCPFVVSTHETALPLGNPEAKTIIVRSCIWSGNRANRWDATLLQDDVGLPEDLKRAILGSRRRILFVEGTYQSLDLQLYSALFPDVSVIPVGSCDDVIRAVRGLGSSKEHHDVESFGLIDADSRSTDDIERLKHMGVYALDQYSVESLYYCSDAMLAVGAWQAKSLGGSAVQMAETAKSRALTALGRDGVATRMAARRCERRVQEQVELQMPNWRSIAQQSNSIIEVDVERSYQEELSRFSTLLTSENLEAILARYPVRHSDAIAAIVGAFQLSVYNYGKTLVSRLRDDNGLADRLRCRIGPLSEAIRSC